MKRVPAVGETSVVKSRVEHRREDAGLL